MNSNSPRQKHFTLNIVKSLEKVKREAKKQHYSSLTAKSDNKMKKTTWNIMKNVTGKSTFSVKDDPHY
jgi:hypothetical protein